MVPVRRADVAKIYAASAAEEVAARRAEYGLIGIGALISLASVMSTIKKLRRAK